MTSSIDYYGKQPEFLGNTVVEIDVPSGRLIASDDLRAVKHFDMDPPMSINYGAGLDAWAKKLAEVNVAYAFVGNTCPSVTERPDGLLQVVSPAPKDEKVVATICTDHWATMLTDYQNWMDHGGLEVEVANREFAIDSYTVIEVTPGRYRWTVYSHSDRFDRDRHGRITYAQLELIEAF